MIARVLRSLIAFGVVFVVYQIYALVAVPMLEPQIARKVTRPLTASDWEGGNLAVEKYQNLLRNYFPAGHWSLSGTPKFLETGPVILAYDQLRKDDRGRVDLTKCAVVMFPTLRSQDNPAPRDAVILEAPGGAQFQFDENFQPSRGKVGRITNGHFPGQITIRSEMREAGPEDDLLIETRDIHMNEQMVFTRQEVNLRLGRSQGRGRQMQIRLLEEEHRRSGGGMKISGIESIELLENVKLEMHVGNMNPLSNEPKDKVASRQSATSSVYAVHQTAYAPASDASEAWVDGPELNSSLGSHQNQPVLELKTQPQVPARVETWVEPLGQIPEAGPAPRLPAGGLPPQQFPPPAGEQPVEVTCAGSFRMDFTTFTATFRDRVHAWQLNLGGQSDQLTCEELRIYFGKGDEGEEVRLDPRNDPDLANRQRRTLADLKPRRLEAVGDPVKVDSPSRGAQARGQSLSLDLIRQRVTLDGGRTFIVHGNNRVEAPVITYEHPEPDNPSTVGRLWVAGPGRLQATPREDRPGDVIEARWRKTPGIEFPVQLAPDHDGRPTLTVLGRPVITAAGVGKLTSDRLRIALRETTPDGGAGPAIEMGKSNDTERRALLPERIDAEGKVEVSSPRLAAATETLTVWMLAKVDGSPQLGRANQRSSGSRSSTDQSMFNTRDSVGKPAYRLMAKRTQLEVAMAGRRTEPTTLVCDGDVRFEQITKKRGEQPLVATGERLRVDDLDSGSVRLTIGGATEGDAAAGKSPLATIRARGMTLNATDAHVDQAKNRVWADGPGTAQVRTDRDIMGQQTRAETDLNLSWKGGWMFDGQKITVRDDVFGEGPHDWVRTNRLVATLTRPIDLSKSSINSSEKIEVAQIDCAGGVTIDHRSVDAIGQKSQERAQLKTLSINQKTGVISGVGPGWVRSVHLAKSGSPLGAIAGSNPKPQQEGAAGLRMLRVHFQGGIGGNLNSRQLEFYQRVQCVYGPVLAWQQDLPLNHPNGLPPDTATLKSDKLTVSEDPTARFAPGAPSTRDKSRIGPLELIAVGNVELEGAAEGKGIFNAQAYSASYNQQKELFILDGSGRQDATLWVQQKPGTQPAKHSAGKISFWRKTQRVKIGNIKSFDYAPAPTAGRPRLPQR